MTLQLGWPDRYVPTFIYKLDFDCFWISPVDLEPVYDLLRVGGMDRKGYETGFDMLI